MTPPPVSPLTHHEPDHVLRALSIAALKLLCEDREQELVELIHLLSPETKAELMRFAVNQLKSSSPLVKSPA
ncbi:hypothetical protein [Spirulina subsalsa]|uniref:hypothetical protein n=1 Tax=Spirulina subsalsa TaxID=54311 RepID=UPI0002FAE7C2|nr:hypothetical protein [Spirulina subsalsa]